MEEGLASPGWGLLQQEMEGAPARERSKEVMAESCHPYCTAERPVSDRLEEAEEEVTGRGLSGEGIYDHRH